ncbi:hypothetical protein K501DRAFT_267004 [Backusella circina FSU 941]|nr:hypothetical protein K501DRAFT_267004 [Backusella circina FSU 941]
MRAGIGSMPMVVCSTWRSLAYAGFQTKKPECHSLVEKSLNELKSLDSSTKNTRMDFISVHKGDLDDIFYCINLLLLENDFTFLCSQILPESLLPPPADISQELKKCKTCLLDKINHTVEVIYKDQQYLRPT